MVKTQVLAKESSHTHKHTHICSKHTAILPFTRDPDYKISKLRRPKSAMYIIEDPQLRTEMLQGCPRFSEGDV